MDIFSHAAAGAATGAAFGRPIAGALIAILPDISIFGPRRVLPPDTYFASHSILFLLLCTGIGFNFEIGSLVFFCLLSHLVLDMPTHGTIWAPRLLWPFSWSYAINEEWEFFNYSWQFGACLTIIWSSVWIFIAW